MLGELAGVRLYSVWEVLTEACHLLNDKYLSPKGVRLRRLWLKD